VPSKEVARTRLETGQFSLIDALVEAGLVKTRSDARRAIEQRGAYVNNVVREGVETTLSPADLASETVMVVRQGKKRYGLLKFV
jgi:tyrosyl-tRNA synthetase